MRDSRFAYTTVNLKKEEKKKTDKMDENFCFVHYKSKQRTIII